MSEIIIQLNQNPQDGDIFVFRDTINGVDYDYSIEFDTLTFPFPIQAGLVPVQADITGSLFALSSHINSFYNTTLLYNIQTDNSGLPYTITITSNNPQSEFSEVSNNTGGRINLVLDNTVSIDPFTITDISAESNLTDVCNLIRLRVQTSLNATTVSSPVFQAVSGDNFLLMDIPRSTNVQVRVQTTVQGELQESIKAVRVPKLLLSYLDFQITNTPFGSSITIVRNYPLSDLGGAINLFTYEYSFDGGLSWGENPSMSGLGEGTYNIQVRDSGGCIVNTDITIEAFEPLDAGLVEIAEISNINSLGWKEDKEWSVCGERRNIDNALSYEEDVRLNFRDFIQNFQICDEIPTQVKTSFDTLTATLYDCEGNTTNVNVLKKSNNMGRIDIRDCTVVFADFNSGGITIFFDSGNVYDELGNVTGDYLFEGILPTWFDIGDFILLEGLGWARIDDIFTLPNGITHALTNLPNSLLPSETLKCTSYFNYVDYERYEFTLPADSLAEGTYYMTLLMQDSNNQWEDRLFKSEWFKVQEEYKERHHLIEYYNSVNNQINFATGIQFRLRVPYVRQLKWSPNTNQDVFVTDTRTVTVENEVREQYTFSSRPLPTKIAQKLIYALSQDRIKIDGITYSLIENAEATPLGTTNTYTVTAILVRADYVFRGNNGITLGEVLLPSETPLSIDDNSDGLLLI